MARSDARGGAQTRAKIAEAANALFVERGFDAVTVADVARAAGVSSVTVFNHFPTKEDLFLDRAGDAADLLRDALAGGDAPVAALRRLAFALADDRNALSGTNPRLVAFVRTVLGAPTLVARARLITAGLQQHVAEALGERPDAALLAAFFVHGYATVFVGSVRQLLDGVDDDTLAADHRARLEQLFAALDRAFPS